MHNYLNYKERFLNQIEFVCLTALGYLKKTVDSSVFLFGEGKEL